MARKTRKRKNSHHANTAAARRDATKYINSGVACAEAVRREPIQVASKRSESPPTESIEVESIEIESVRAAESDDTDLSEQTSLTETDPSPELSPLATAQSLKGPSLKGQFVLGQDVEDSLDLLQSELEDELEVDNAEQRAAEARLELAEEELAEEVGEAESRGEPQPVWQSEWQPPDLTEFELPGFEPPGSELSGAEFEEAGSVDGQAASSEVATPDQSQAILHAIDDNSLLLRQLLADFADLQSQVVEAAVSPRDSVASDESDGIDRAQHETAIELLRDEIVALEDELCELKRQNSDLAAKVANASVRKSTSDTASDFTEALSWEERKQLILRQMEEDCFDAETFLTQTVQSRLSDAGEAGEPECEVDPVAFVEELTAEISRLQQQNERFEKEIGELNHLLEQRPQSAAGGMAIGAAAIAEMIDADELIQEERQRLQTLQTQWEEKFRQAEIEASLERAKLSRERQEVATKLADLDEQLDRLRRDAAQNQSGEGHSRKWLAKLGLAGDD
ncbi:hypothetical protein [Novipirellula sp.]|uniref:hypothetical protein n=1 Tax=Novipirellula sp. TaxID=2795430 RepID=UPI003566EBE1